MPGSPNQTRRLPEFSMREASATSSQYYSSFSLKAKKLNSRTRWKIDFCGLSDEARNEPLLARSHRAAPQQGCIPDNGSIEHVIVVVIRDSHAEELAWIRNLNLVMII